MEVISSFKIDHEKLLEGIYLSRNDKDIYTYDIRIKKPNRDKVMTTGEAHAIEHLGATYLRNSNTKDMIIYFGPMGCMTGFYLIGRDYTLGQAIVDTIDMMCFIVDYEGDIPGATPEECGNYSDMDLEGAKEVCREYLEVLRELDAYRVNYPGFEDEDNGYIDYVNKAFERLDF